MYLENGYLYKPYEKKRKNGSIICRGIKLIDENELLSLYDTGNELAAQDRRIPVLLAEREENK